MSEMDEVMKKAASSMADRIDQLGNSVFAAFIAAGIPEGVIEMTILNLVFKCYEANPVAMRGALEGMFRFFDDREMVERANDGRGK